MAINRVLGGRWFRLAPVRVDGAFGPKTEKALGAAQQILGVDATGVADRATMDALELSSSAGVDVGPQWLAVEHVWKGSKRRRPITAIVLHETVTETDHAAVRVLTRRHLSTHYTVHTAGESTRTMEVMDPTRRAAHAGGGWNDPSIGIDISNRYYGEAKAGETRIKARWADRGTYRVQPAAEYEAVWRLVEYLCGRFPSIPLTFPGVELGPTGQSHFRWGTWPKGDRGPRHGIVSHHRCSMHADGMFAEHYCALRAAAVTPKTAMHWTLQAAEQGGRTLFA